MTAGGTGFRLGRTAMVAFLALTAGQCGQANTIKILMTERAGFLLSGTPMTASAGQTPPGGAACPASPSWSPWSTGAWASPARPAGRPRSPSSFRCVPGTADAHRDRRGRRVVPGRAGPAAGGRGPPGLRRTHPGTAVLVLSQYIETRYAAQLLQGSPAGVGYLLEDRVADLAEFCPLAKPATAGSWPCCVTSAPDRVGSWHG